MIEYIGRYKREEKGGVTRYLDLYKEGDQHWGLPFFARNGVLCDELTGEVLPSSARRWKTGIKHSKGMVVYYSRKSLVLSLAKPIAKEKLPLLNTFLLHEITTPGNEVILIKNQTK